MNELLKPEKFAKTNDFEKDTKQSVRTILPSSISILLNLLLPGMYFLLFYLSSSLFQFSIYCTKTTTARSPVSQK